jgi:hypothetical protein
MWLYLNHVHHQTYKYQHASDDEYKYKHIAAC